MLRATLVLLSLLFVGCSAQEECSNQKADFFFLLDASGSVGDIDFQTTRDFVKNFADGFAIGPNNVQIGVATFADDARLRIKLNQYQDRNALLEAIQNVEYTMGSTQTGSGINLVVDAAFTPENGGRSGVPRYLFVITDGASTDSEILMREAERLHQAGIIAFAAGVGLNVNRDELLLIANNRSPRVFMVNDFGILGRIQQRLTSNVCASLPDVLVPIFPTCIVDFKPSDPNVILKCNSARSYPEALCHVNLQTEGGSQRFVGNPPPTYNHVQGSTGSQTSYDSTCSLEISKERLGEGTHSFSVIIYPNVEGGIKLISLPTLTAPFTIAGPADPTTASHVCESNMMENYLCGQSVSCNCTLEPVGAPGFVATWFKGGIVDLHTDVLTLTYSPNDPEVEYTCEAVSGMDHTFGSSLKITTETSCDNQAAQPHP